MIHKGWASGILWMEKYFEGKQAMFFNEERNTLKHADKETRSRNLISGKTHSCEQVGYTYNTLNAPEHFFYNWSRDEQSTLSSIVSLFKIASIMRLNITATYMHFGRRLFSRTCGYFGFERHRGGCVSY